jgi:hypothetical protein
MKLNEIANAEPMLYRMLLKLVEKGQPVYVNALGKTFLSGNDARGYEALRANKQGWIRYFDFRDPEASVVEDVKRHLERDVLTLSSYKEDALYGKGAHSSSLFEFEKPVDGNYTLRKINDTWTIIDRNAVNEEEKKIPLVWALAKKQRYDKKKRVSVSAYFEGAAGNYKHLHGELMQVNDDEAWIQMERRTYIVRFTDTDDLYLTLKKDPYSDFYWIVNTEAGKKIDEAVQPIRDRDQEAFILKLALKAFQKAGLDASLEFTELSGAPHILSSFAGFTIATHYDSATEGDAWLNAWFKNGQRAAPIQHFKSYKEALADIVGLRYEDR